MVSLPEPPRPPEKLKKLCPDNYIQAELHVRAPSRDGFGMHGSGMFLINPPYTLPDILRNTLPALRDILRQDDGARFVLDYKIR